MKQLPHNITTITGMSEFRMKEKGSLFIAKAFHTGDETEAMEVLMGTKKKYYDASHNCYAYKFANGNFKYSDDGEPNGTAGIRILNAINHEDLSNVLLIVTRYFGGTKLGVGPLGKAYYKVAIEAIKQAEITNQKLHNTATVKFDFEYSNLVHRLISNFSIKMERTDFTETPNMTCLIPSESIEEFVKSIELESHSKIEIVVSNNSRYI